MRRRAESRLQAHLETVEKTNIWYGDYENPIYIPNAPYRRDVTFAMDPERGCAGEIRVGINPHGEFEVMGGRQLVLEPRVSNVVKIKLGD